jgi:hypothetical protein
MFGSVALGVPLAAALALFAKPLILFWAGPSAVPDSDLIGCLCTPCSA